LVYVNSDADHGDAPAEKELEPVLADKPSKETIVEAFTAAKEIIEDSKNKDKPELLVRRALSAIKRISPRSSRLSHSAVKAMLRELAKQVGILLKPR
jgi:acetylglutamate kinase